MHHDNPVKNFLLVGNGAYHNRGCEAIVRGTAEILAQAVAPVAPTITNAFYGDAPTLDWQRAADTDGRVSHIALNAYPRKWTRDWLEDRLNGRFGTGFPTVHRPLIPMAREALCALEIGGDNYTLDYGYPEHLVKMDRSLRRCRLPVVIWGASIGPFSEHPGQERAMMAHLRALDAIFVRESATFDYLVNGHGLKNVHQFADPAFAMTPAEPAEEAVRALVADAPLIVNISPLLAAYRGARCMAWDITRDDLRAWVAEVAEIIRRLHESTGLPVLLLPHVGSELPGLDDWGFLAAVREKCSDDGKTLKSGQADMLKSEVAESSVSGFGISAFQHLFAKSPIRLLTAELNARELKWLIARGRALVAARTHATIAAFSTGVPTVSLGYSRKAQGINKDVFGTTDYCVKSTDLNAERLVSVVQRVLREEDAIRKHLAVRSTELKASAMAAGPALLGILAEGQQRSV